MKTNFTRRMVLGLAFATMLASSACFDRGNSESASTETPRLVLFVGIDISGSFMKSQNFEDSMNFLANYLYGHLNGLGGLEVPHSLFVGSIGGAKRDEAKSLYPIQIFQNSSAEEIRAKLTQLFPKAKPNPLTDFNSFFDQVATTVSNKKLLLKPLSVVMLTDGVPDLPGKDRASKFRKLDLSPLEQLSRNVTVRILYTDAVTAKLWQDQVPRKRVKIWTQDAVVMREWKNPKTFLPGKHLPQQRRFLAWVKDNVDFSARLKRVE